MNKRSKALFAAVLTLCAWTGLAADPSLWDDFDGYGVGQTFSSPVNGWQSSSNGVVVTNAVSQSAPNAVLVPGNSTLTNTVNGGTDKVIWTDCYVKPVAGELPSDLPVESASLVAYFNPSGYVQVATASGWVTCSNDVWGGVIAPATSGFARVSIYQNYSASNAALMVDGRLAIQDLRFVGSANAYNGFMLMNASSNAWLDNVWIKTNYDAATLTNDFNSNGTVDAAELASYGYVARTLYVGIGSGYPQYNDFAGALTNWRARDLVYVYGGTYAEDVVVSNSVTFGGNVFTNTGTLTVKSGATPVFENGMTWGSVVVDTNATVSLGQDLGCSTLVVRAGATLTVQAVTCSNVVVETGASLTCLGAFECANSVVLDAGATAAFSNIVSCPGTVTLASTSVMTLEQGATVGTLACTGSVTLAAGKSLTVGTASVPGAVYVSAGGTATVATALSMPVGGHIDFAQSTFLLSPLSVNMVGTFVISNNWGAGSNVWVSSGANVTFPQALVCDTLAMYASATSTFQAVSCAALVAQDGSRLTVQGALACGGNATLGQNVTAGFSNVVTCGAALDVGTNSTATFSQAVTCTTLVVRAGATVTVASLTCSNLVVEPGAHFTCLGAFQCDSTASIGTGAVATFSGSVNCGGAFTVAGGATVSLGQGATLGSLDATGTVVVGAGKTLTVGAATVSGVVQVSGSGVMVVNGTLSVSGSGLLTFTNSQLTVTSGNVVLNGTFTVNNTWGQSAAVLPLPFVDDFERYWDGAKISELGFAGWGATATNVVVQSSVANSAFGGSKGLSIPAGTVVSNRIVTTAKKIWTDCFVKPSLGQEPFGLPTNTAGFVSFVDTNGWLEVATSNGWDVCSNLVSGGQPDRMTTSSWTRITVCQNLTNDTVAVFINGKLVRQLLKTPGSPVSTYTSFAVDCQDGQAYLDDVAIKTTWPTTITADLDQDIAPDAYEVDVVGSVTERDDLVMRGSVYLLR